MWNLKINDRNELTYKIERHSQSQRTNLWFPVHAAVYKMDNQQGPTGQQQGTLFSVMWQPGWVGSLGENGYMYMYG